MIGSFAAITSFNGFFHKGVSQIMIDLIAATTWFNGFFHKGVSQTMVVSIASCYNHEMG